VEDDEDPAVFVLFDESGVFEGGDFTFGGAQVPVAVIGSEYSHRDSL
jgi:hypothetical protein